MLACGCSGRRGVFAVLSENLIYLLLSSAAGAVIFEFILKDIMFSGYISQPSDYILPMIILFVVFAVFDLFAIFSFSKSLLTKREGEFK